jgi:RNA polymerase sigma factor (TIGR02999 family)
MVARLAQIGRSPPLRSLPVTILDIKCIAVQQHFSSGLTTRDNEFHPVSNMTEAQPITVLLQQFAGGDKEALNRLIPLVYAELHRLAEGYLRQERTGHTLQPTALVHEAYVRLLGQQHPDYQGRAHFLGVSAQVMRQILIDHARKRNAVKRGGTDQKCSLDEARDAVLERPSVAIALDDALNALEQKDTRKARLLEMRFFGGLTAEESAEALALPVGDVRRELRVALAWLQREFNRQAKSSS